MKLLAGDGAILATNGLRPCGFLCIRDPETGKTRTTHLDAKPRLDSLEALLVTMPEQGQLQAKFFSGQGNISQQLRAFLEQHQIETLTEIITGEPHVNYIALDTATGDFIHLIGTRVDLGHDRYTRQYNFTRIMLGLDDADRALSLEYDERRSNSPWLCQFGINK